MNSRRAVKLRFFVPFLAFAWYLPVTDSKPDELTDPGKLAADPMLGKKLGQVRDDNAFKMKFVWCPPGFVAMEQVEVIEQPVPTNDEAHDDHDPDDEPETRTVTKETPVKVLVTRGYWLGKYEVTQSEWKQVMGTEPWKGQKFTKEGDDFPTTFVDWDDAMEFGRKLTERERMVGRLPNGWEYTLPTEAQWERGCRARTETRFSFGDEESKLGEYAWFGDNAKNANEQYAHRVGQKKSNPWGLHDIHGNVWEWCHDWYQDSYKLPGGRDPDVTTPSSLRVIRGGSWGNFFGVCGSSNRGRCVPMDRSPYIGFRVVLTSVRHAKPAEPDADARSTIDK